MGHHPSIRLFDLVVASGCTISPFVWRAKYAIAHKGFAVEGVPTSFTGVRRILDGAYQRLPVIVDEDRVVADSWAIAEYLDQRYPDRPMLFGSECEAGLVRFLDAWLWRDVFPPLFHCYVLDNIQQAFPEDRAYLRESRERLFLGGRPAEEIVAGREERLPAIRRTWQPLRDLLGTRSWLGGHVPNYSDFCVLSVFLWAASIATVPPVEAGDPLLDWIDRGFDLYGGLGRHPGMHPLTAQNL